MSHFAKVENGVVTQVIVIEKEVLDLGHWGDPASWVQTSYNTQGGVHQLGGTPMRKNYAGIGVGALQRQVASSNTQDGNGEGGINASRTASYV